MAKTRAIRRRLGPALIALSLSAGCRSKAEWVVEIVYPSDATVDAADVDIYRSTAPDENAQFVATAKGRASKSPSLPGIYASLRDEASELGANLVIVEIASTAGLEYSAGSTKPSLIPVPYVFVNATFYSTPGGD